VLPLLLAGSLLFPRGPAEAQRVADALRARFATGGPALAPLARLYQPRGFRPAWVTDSGASFRAADLLLVIDAAYLEGLNPDDYETRALRGLFGRPPAPAPADSLAGVELQVTRMVLAYATDLARGRIDPAAANSLWTRASGIEMTAAVGAVLDTGPLAATLFVLAPPQPQYSRLRSALARYRDLAARGGWPVVPSGSDLMPGARDARVPTLRARLQDEGALGPGTGVDDTYDRVLEDGVRDFQARHGLAEDGIVSAATLAALNVPAAERVRQIELNLERWRWLPRELGDRYVMVNSAAFTLEVIDHGRRVMEMPVIVGRPDWPTPIAQGRVTGLVFNPVWDIPRAIASQEIVPLIRRDSTYVARHGITVYRDSGRVLQPVDPVTVDWSAITESTFTLRLKQAPGSDNPLGAVKAVFGTRFNVCLHDTPAHAPFRERVRTFSHGCVRVARAADLATYLLDDSLRWSSDSVKRRMAVGREQPVPLRRGVPAYLVYWTAWVGDDGSVAFREDVYGWDRELAAALAARKRPAGSP
jgi:murein L,D-transpeptidase YcbB/YkuD